MKIHNTGRGGGKTYDLVQWYRENPRNRLIVTATASLARFHANEYRLPTSAFAPYLHLEEVLRGRPGLEIAFDDCGDVLEMAMRRYFGIPDSQTIAVLAMNLEPFRDRPLVRAVSDEYAARLKQLYPEGF